MVKKKYAISCFNSESDTIIQDQFEGTEEELVRTINAYLCNYVKDNAEYVEYVNFADKDEAPVDTDYAEYSGMVQLFDFHVIVTATEITSVCNFGNNLSTEDFAAADYFEANKGFSFGPNADTEDYCDFMRIIGE